MRKKFFYTILAFLFTLLSSNASSDKVHVSALEHFSTANPQKTIDVKVIDASMLGDYLLKQNDVIHCNVIEVKQPMRGKRSASFIVCPTSYTTEGQNISIDKTYHGQYSAKILSKEELKNVDKKKIGKKAVITVSGHFVKGVAPVVALAEGMIKNEEGNVIESGVKQVYKESPISYIEKGAQVELEEGTPFYLIFKPANSKTTVSIEEEQVNDEE